MATVRWLAERQVLTRNPQSCRSGWPPFERPFPACLPASEKLANILE